MKTVLIACSSIAVTAVAGFVVQPTEKQVHPTIRVAALDADESNASQTLLGQMRTSASAWLYLRADLYLHNGVELRRMSEQEVKDGQKGVGSADNLVASDSAAITVVPNARRDFRGVLGEIERATSTYKPMEHHGHQSPEQSLPLFKLMTLADPQFLTGWTMGASILAADHKDASTDKALQFLNDGLRQNYRSVELWDAIGVLYAANKKDYVRAKEYLLNARYVGLKTPHLSEPEAASLLETYRWLTLIAKETETDFDRMRIAREGLKLFPDDELLKRLS